MKIFILLLLMSLSLWANIGSILAMKGSAEVQRDQNILKATSGMKLLKGDNIITSSKSRVQVMLHDETVITIGASSSFSFEEYIFDGTKNSKLTMRANRGFFRSVTGKIGKIAPERFKVKTASATIGIRGTDFSGDIMSGREVFKCYQGAIFIEFDDGVEDVHAGMMIEILKDKFEKLHFKIGKIKKIPSSQSLYKDVKPSTKPHKAFTQKDVTRVGIMVESIDGSEIPTEVISDITQIINEENTYPEEEPGVTVDIPEGSDDVVVPEDEVIDEESAAAAAAAAAGEPFTVDPNSDDREEEY